VGDLLHRFQGGGPRHRTLRLEPVTDAVLGIPNYPRKPAGSFAKLRIEFRPDDDEDFGLSMDGDRLVMTVGQNGIDELAHAFGEVARGGGDFGIASSGGRNAERWMFWWMPDVNYRLGKRS
jgi:hypothetical protein